MPSLLAFTDGSIYAPSVYRHAAWAASRLAATVRVVHAIERLDRPVPHDLSGTIGFDAGAELLTELARHDEAQARLARLRGEAILADAERQLRDLAPDIVVETTQRLGSVVDGLETLEEGVDLIVLGKRGEHADFANGHLGSNLERVARSASLPVLVAAREFRQPRRFLLAFDGGPSSIKAVRYLASSPLLDGMEGQLIAVGAPDPALAGSLADAAAELRTAGFAITAEQLEGDVEETIAREVADREIDLLVMGAYGHSRVRQFLLGSTTTTLLRTCPVPVLLFR